MRALVARIKANHDYPFVDKAAILSGGQMTTVIAPAWEDPVIASGFAFLKPVCERLLARIGDFELNGVPRLLLHNHAARTNAASDCDIA